MKKKHFYIYRLILTNKADGTICTKALTANKRQGPEGRTILMVSLIGSFHWQHFPLSLYLCCIILLKEAVCELYVSPLEALHFC